MTPISAVHLRDYNRIFTGTNQKSGYETPFFGFTANTIELVFEADKTTYFHYPHTAPNTLLKLSSLAYDGAVAGKAPYYSDKIWKKMANYYSSSIWGASQPIGKRTGVWLCSWLSGNSNDLDATPLWKDRWYNPGYIDSVSAMFIENPLSSVVIDIDSEMILDAGSYFKYFHVGNNTNTVLINTLSGVDNLKLHIEDWSENPVDLSLYDNTSKIQYYVEGDVSEQGVNFVDNSDDDCITLNGTNYCETLYNSSIALTGDFTYNIWGQSDDWTKGNNTILSKNCRGGYSLKADQGFNTPFIVFMDNAGKWINLNTEGELVTFNTENKTLISKMLPSSASQPTSLAIDEYNFIWVADNGAKRVYKIDYNGDILNEIVFNSSVVLSSITLDSEKLWVLDSNGNSLSSFNLFTTKIISTSATGPALNYITTNVTNTVLGTSGTIMVVDNANNSWTVESGLVYKNNTYVTSGDFIACDKDNNIWILFDTNGYVKMDSTSLSSISGTVGDNTTATNRRLDFAYENDNNSWTSFAYFTFENEQKVYKTDLEGNSINTINLANFAIYPNLITFTSYDWNRKLNYLKYDKEPQFQTVLFTTNGTDVTKNLISIPLSGFNNTNWHMFTVTRNSDLLSFYVDSVLQETLSGLSTNQTYYKYENPLFLGAENGKIEPLRKELLFNSDYFKGKIDSIRIYDYALDLYDINQLYFDKYKFLDLKWNIPTGLQNYIEEIIRFFKFKPPGQKSQYYNINLIGLNIQDETVKELIEDSIKNTLKKVTPVYAELYKIIWK